MKVLVVESTSEGQAATARRLESIDRVDKDTLDLSVGLANEQSALERLSSCDVLLLGASLGDHALRVARRAKLASPSLEILMLVSRDAYSGGAFRSALSHGTRKVFSESAPLLDIVQELMSIQAEFRTRGRVRSGRVIAVVQAKGGIGVTSTCAALAEVCGSFGQSTMLWDLDIETRDLCRALMVEGDQPSIVSQMVTGAREVSRESLRMALMRVTDCVSILPPPDQMAASVDMVGRIDAIEVVQSLINVARATHDNVIIDLGGRLGPSAGAIMRNADAVVVMVDDSLLGLSAVRFFLTTMQSVLRSPESLFFLCSGISVSQAQLAAHIGEQFSHGPRAWSLPVIPFDAVAAKWPGSGRTLYSAGKKGTRRAFEQLAAALQLVEEEVEQPQRLLPLLPSSLVPEVITTNVPERPSAHFLLNPFKMLWQRVSNS